MSMKKRQEALDIIREGIRLGFYNTTDPSNYILNQLMKAGFIKENVSVDLAEIEILPAKKPKKLNKPK